MVFVRELTDFLRLSMRRDRVVSGDCVNKLASIGQAPDSLTPRVVMGCIKANAICDEAEGVVGVLISTADVASLKKKAGELTKAEAIIARARALTAEHSVPNIDKIGRLEIALIKCILKKPKHWTEDRNDGVIDRGAPSRGGTMDCD